MAKPQVKAQSPKGRKQEARFVEEYLIDLNATQAAIRIGYSPKCAEKFGCLMLKRPEVAQAVQAAMDARSQKTGITAERVLNEIGKLAFANIMDYIVVGEDGNAVVDLSKLTREQASAIQEITVDQYAGGAGDGERKQVVRTRFKMADKGLNLERLGRHLKLFSDKVELTGKDGEPIQTSVVVRFVDGSEEG